MVPAPQLLPDPGPCKALWLSPTLPAPSETVPLPLLLPGTLTDRPTLRDPGHHCFHCTQASDHGSHRAKYSLLLPVGVGAPNLNSAHWTPAGGPLALNKECKSKSQGGWLPHGHHSVCPHIPALWDNPSHRLPLSACPSHAICCQRQVRGGGPWWVVLIGSLFSPKILFPLSA